MNRLRISGYNESYRFQLLSGILNEWKNIREKIDSGARIEFRSREQILEAKTQKVGKHPSTWFFRGRVQNTYKVQITPKSALVNTMSKVMKNRLGAEGGKTKFVELGGSLITSGIKYLQGPNYPKICTCEHHEQSYEE